MKWRHRIGGLAVGVVFAGLVHAQGNTLFLNDSAVAQFRDSDMQSFLETMDASLDGLADGETRSWENPDTKAHGSIGALRTFEREGRTCRQMRVENNARGRRGVGKWTYCRSAEGRWELQAP
jgi:surface antigen